MPAPIDAYGNPEAVLCRWCDEGRERLRGTMFCRRCDSPALEPATWQVRYER